MIHQQVVQWLDDLDGTEADETLTFTFAGVTYEIDLSARNVAAMRETMALYVGHARLVARSSPRPSRASGGNRPRGRVEREQTRAIRVWARANGFEVNDRGRIPDPVLQAYHSSH